MKAKLYTIEDVHADDDKIKKASNIIQNGGLVIFPTETVYGLGADAFNPVASEKIYSAKGRPSDNPLILHISDLDMLNKIVKNVPEKANKLMNQFWPGPLTIIFEKKDIVSDKITGGLNTVAVRMPSNLIALSFIRNANTPIAAPSANISGKPSITRWEDAVEEMGNRVDAILLSEPSEIGLESTIIDLTQDVPMILRVGKISKTEIEKEIGFTEIDKTIFGEKDIPKAPGMKYKHYSPNAEVFIASKEDFVEKVKQKYKASPSCNTVIFTMNQNKSYFKDEKVYLLGETTLQAAKVFFHFLRKADKEGYDTIIMEDISFDEIGEAVMNRARKSAGNKYL